MTSLFLSAFVARIAAFGMAAGLILLALGAGPAAAQELKPLPVPEWVRNSLCATFTPPQDEAGWDAAVKAGLQVAFNIGTVGGYTFYDGKQFYDLEAKKPFSAAKPIDLSVVRKAVAQAQKHGVRVVGTMPPMWEKKVMADHPDWQRLTTPDARPVNPYTADNPIGGCWMSPFGDWYIHKNEELVKALGYDGQIIDGFGTYTLCYCPYCKAAYKKATGAETPLKTDPNDPNYRRYLRWRLEEWGKYVHKWEKALKKLNPDFAFIPWSTGPGRWWHWTFLPNTEGSELGNLMVDAPILELFWDFPPDQSSNLLPSFTVRFYRGFCQERPVWMLPYFRSQGQQQAVTPLVESEFRTLTVLTNGGVPTMGNFALPDGVDESHFFHIINQCRPWVLKATSQKWAALLVSENSRLFYGIPGTRGEYGGPFIGSGVDTKDLSKLPPSERRLPAHMESAIGVFRACEEAHVPLDIVSDLDVEQGTLLDKYKVLILPDAACLSEKAMQNMRRFVANGGGLVATQSSSLYDENGNRRGNFGLSDLFHAKFERTEDHTARWPDFANTANLEFSPNPITDDPTIRGSFPHDMKQVNYIGWTTVVAPDASAQVISRFFPYKDYALQSQTANPFLLLSETGKGRTAYFAGAVGQSYFVTPYQYERPLIVNAIRWAAGENKPPVEVQAPMCVQATFYTQENGKRTVVHLLNEINTTGNRALPPGDPPMREEVVPIGGITVTFHDPAITRVHLEPEGEDLPLQKVDGGVEVTVPQLKLHAMVVAER